MQLQRSYSICLSRQLAVELPVEPAAFWGGVGRAIVSAGDLIAAARLVGGISEAISELTQDGRGGRRNQNRKIQRRRPNAHDTGDQTHVEATHESGSWPREKIKKTVKKYI